MTTQSKSVLIPFLIIAGLLFAAALGWKFFGSNDTEPTVKIKTPAVVEILPAGSNEAAKPETASTEVVTREVNVEPEPFMMPTQEEREAAQEVARSNMKFAMRYSTVEKAMTALEKYKNTGNTEMVRSLVGFIEKTYPEIAIPSEYLDI